MVFLENTKRHTLGHDNLCIAYKYFVIGLFSNVRKNLHVTETASEHSNNSRKNCI